MAKKKVVLDISKLTGLKWTKETPDTYREEIASCSFCKASIYDNQNWYSGSHPDISMDPTGGETLFYSCQSCATKAGLEW